MKNRPLSGQQMKKMIAEQTESGLSVRKWCRQKDINHSTYCSWISIIRKAAEKDSSGTQGNELAQSYFIPVEVLEEVTPAVVQADNANTAMGP